MHRGTSGNGGLLAVPSTMKTELPPGRCHPRPYERDDQADGSLIDSTSDARRERPRRPLGRLDLMKPKDHDPQPAVVHDEEL